MDPVGRQSKSHQHHRDFQHLLKSRHDRNRRPLAGQHHFFAEPLFIALSRRTDKKIVGVDVDWRRRTQHLDFTGDFRRT